MINRFCLIPCYDGWAHTISPCSKSLMRLLSGQMPYDHNNAIPTMPETSVPGGDGRKKMAVLSGWEGRHVPCSVNQSDKPVVGICKLMAAEEDKQLWAGESGCTVDVAGFMCLGTGMCEPSSSRFSTGGWDWQLRGKSIKKKIPTNTLLKKIIRPYYIDIYLLHWYFPYLWENGVKPTNA